MISFCDFAFKPRIGGRFWSNNSAMRQLWLPAGGAESIPRDILESFVDRGQLHHLTQPTVLPGAKRIPGLKLDHPRQLALMHALVCFAHTAAGNTFTHRRTLSLRVFPQQEASAPSPGCFVTKECFLLSETS